MAKRWFVDQGTPEWRKLRLGVPTSSNFHRIITPKTMKPSAERFAYRNELICERLLLDTIENKADRIKWVERGKLDQPKAARQLTWTHDLELEPIGFVTMDDGSLGCSPDMLVVGRNECVEIKCPEAHTHMGYLLDGPGADYRPQVQGQLLVGEFERAHFYSWHERMPPVHLIIERDEEFIGALAECLEAFLVDLDEKTAEARSLGTYMPHTWAQVVDPERLTEYLQ